MNMQAIEIDQARLKAIRKEVEEQYYVNYKTALEQEIGMLFRKQVLYNGKEHHSEGIIRTMIKEQVQTFYTSEKLQKRAEAYIDAAFNPQLDKCIESAISHAIRRENFNDLVQHTKDQLKK